MWQMCCLFLVLKVLNATFIIIISILLMFVYQKSLVCKYLMKAPRVFNSNKIVTVLILRYLIKVIVICDLVDIAQPYQVEYVSFGD